MNCIFCYFVKKNLQLAGVHGGAHSPKTP